MVQASSKLPKGHPTAVAFLDESGSIARDRFFAVGCLKLTEPSVLLRQVQKLRDREHFYEKIHFKDLTKKALPFYKGVVDLVVAGDAEFSCFVADRDTDDAVARFGSEWKAYEKLAEQLLVGSIRPKEILSVLPDRYSTPDDVYFEQDIRRNVNTRLRRLAIASVCRLDSRATDPLQIVDLLTSSVAHEFRQAAGQAASGNPKARLAKYVREAYGVSTCVTGCKMPRFNVALYQGSLVKSKATSATGSSGVAEN